MKIIINAIQSGIQRRPVLFVCVALIVLVWVAFGRTLNYGFVNFDDPVKIYENPYIASGLTLQGIVWAFTGCSVTDTYWDPLSAISHMVDCQLYGLNAGGHHLTNVLLHTATAILLFLLLKEMTGALWRAAFVAAVFAVHPLRVESVAWVTERRDVLSGLFFMLMLWAYARYVRDGKSPAQYGLMVLWFALGLMSKPMLVTAPVVLLLLDYWPLNRFAGNQNGGAMGVASRQRWDWPLVKSLVVEKIPLFALAALFCAITLLAQRNIIVPLEKWSPLDRLLNALVSYATYLGQMIYPAKLAVLYPFPPHGIPIGKSLLAAAVLAAVSAGAFIWRKNRPFLIIGWLWYLVMLLPVIGIFQSGQQAHADRFTYLPQIGLYLMAAWMATELASGRRRPLVLGSLAVVSVVVLTLAARHQTSFWKNSESAWTHTLACNFDNSVAHNNLGADLFQTGRADEAVVHFQQALAIQPDYTAARDNLGIVLLKRGRVDEAIGQFQQALAVEPGYIPALDNLGTAFLQKGRADEAIAQFQKALAIQPDYIPALDNLGAAFLQKGRVDEAIGQFQKELALQPGRANAHDNLGHALLQKNRLDEAIAQFQQALAIRPDYVDALNSLGAALFKKGRLDEAIAQFQKAQVIQPDSTDAKALNNYGEALFKAGRTEEATVQFHKALAFQSDSAEAHNNIGYALFEKGQLDEAIGQFQKALAIQPDYILALDNLGAARLQKGQTDEAIAQFQKVLASQPGHAKAHYYLGHAFLQKGQLDEAVGQFQKALASQPDDIDAQNSLGAALFKKGRVDEAIEQFQKVLAVQPGSVVAQGNLGRIAWMLATSPDPSFRNGTKAVELARQMDRLSGGGNPSVAATLAAAFAEAGQFPEAITNAQRALQLSATQGDTGMAAVIQAQLKLYQAGSPFHNTGASR